MRYLIFPTEQEAISRSEQEAQDRGCGETTSAWWAWRQMADGRFALLADDDTPGAVAEAPEWLAAVED